MTDHAAWFFGTALSSRWMMSSMATPSLWAVKLRMRRWRRIGVGHGGHVVGRHVVLPVQHRVRLGGQDQVHAGARAGAPGQPFVDEVGRLRECRAATCA